RLLAVKKSQLYCTPMFSQWAGHCQVVGDDSATRLSGIFGERTYAIASSFLDTSLRLAAPGDGGKSRRSLHHSGEAQTLVVTPHAVPSLGGLGGGAPPARPSDRGAA